MAESQFKGTVLIGGKSMGAVAGGSWSHCTCCGEAQYIQPKCEAIVTLYLLWKSTAQAAGEAAGHIVSAVEKHSSDSGGGNCNIVSVVGKA